LGSTAEFSIFAIEQEKSQTQVLYEAFEALKEKYHLG
jgi:hypothetical protein